MSPFSYFILIKNRTGLDVEVVNKIETEYDEIRKSGSANLGAISGLQREEIEKVIMQQDEEVNELLEDLKQEEQDVRLIFYYIGKNE